MPDNRMPDSRMPDSRMPDSGIPDNRYPRDSRFPDDTRSDPRNSPGRVDPRTIELDAQYRTADQYLNEMAEKSGGKLTRADTLLSLPAAFAQIAAELRTQYALGYYPSNAARDGKYRKLQVRTKRKNVLIRARPGYRAPG